MQILKHPQVLDDLVELADRISEDKFQRLPIVLLMPLATHLNGCRNFLILEQHAVLKIVNCTICAAGLYKVLRSI